MSSNYEQRDMSGTLFRNDKGDNEKRPDYTGELMVNGEPFRLSAWLKTSSKGTKFMSLAVTPKEDKPAKPAKKPAFDDADQDVPF